MIKKSKLITLTDIAAFISFIFVVSTGVFMRYMLPPGSGRFAEIFGMSRHQWGDIHFFITCIFLAVLSIHLILHWRFIHNVFQGQFKNATGIRLFLGLVAIIAVLALAISPFIVSKEISTINSTQGYKHGQSNK